VGQIENCLLGFRFGAACGHKMATLTSSGPALQSGYANDVIPARVEFQDRGFGQGKAEFVCLFLFLVAVVSHLAVGFFFVANTNLSIEDDGTFKFDQALIQEQIDCISVPGRLLAEADNCRDLWCVLGASPAVAVISILLAPVLGFLWMLALYQFPQAMTWGSVIFNALLYILIGVALLIEGLDTRVAGLFIALGIGIFIILWYTRNSIIKAGEHIKTATIALSKNKDVFIATGIVELLLLGFLGLHWWFLLQGSLVYEVNSDTCNLVRPSNVQKMLQYQFFVLFWVTAYFNSTKLVITAMSIAQWYFDQSDKVERAPFVALKIAFTKSSGTIAAGSLVTGLVDYLVRKANAQFWWLDPLGCVLKCLFLCLESIVMAYTRYLLVVHSLTGRNFFNSGMAVTSIIARNFDGAYIVDRVAVSVIEVGTNALAIVIGVIAWAWIDRANDWSTLSDLTGPDSVFGGLVGFLVFIFLFLYLTRRPLLSIMIIALINDTVFKQLNVSAQIFAPMAGIFVACIAAIILSFQGDIVLNTIDTIFITYAVGNDNNLAKPVGDEDRALVYALVVDVPEAKLVSGDNRA